MRFYLDHNMPYTCVELLKKRKHNVVHAKDLGYETKDDHFHHQEAKRQKRILVTRNIHDFSNDTDFPLAKHPGIVIIGSADVVEGLALFLETLPLVLRSVNRGRPKTDRHSGKALLYETRVTVGARGNDFPLVIKHRQFGTLALTEEEILFVYPKHYRDYPPYDDVFPILLNKD